jgi:magnesium chelatase accessory protein
MRNKLIWATDGADWPNREASRFVTAAGFSWHVQVMGSGPVLLALHGTGASTHSWRELMPMLARDFTVIAPDMPGHAFTDTPDRKLMSLPGMARAVAALLKTLGMVPEVAIGHSAGAAILARMVIDKTITPRLMASFNGALLPLPSMPSELFAPLARALVSLPFLPKIAAWQAGSPGAVDRLIGGTGSNLDARGIALYQRLISNPGHVAGALEMMAEWNLRELNADLPKLSVPVLQIIGAKDQTIPPADADRLLKILPQSQKILLPDLGHLAHEENPAEHANLLREALFA